MTTLETVWHGATWREAEPPEVVVRVVERPVIAPDQPLGERIMALMADGQRRRQYDMRLALHKGYTTVRNAVQVLVEAGRLTRTPTCRDIWYQVAVEPEEKDEHEAVVDTGEAP